jgi:hypothetical protein
VSRFHGLRSQTHFRRYIRRRVPFSCFALLDSFSAVPTASGPVFMFYVPRIVFGGAECVGSRFHVLPYRTRYRRCRRRRVTFSCFARPDLFSAVARVSGPVFMFCAPRLIFGGTESVGSRFHVLRSRTHFSEVSRALGPFFMFCTPGHIFGITGGVRSRFHVLRARTRYL